ncbi:MAG: peptide chain release factor N(5)-glutamine methyltransferase, partial [Anaerolineae bacterium]
SAIRTLSSARCPTPRLDAEVLLAHVLQTNRAWLHAHRNDPLAPDAARAYSRLIQRRARHEPVAYITGEREFFGLSFEVTPAALIPRPETELLVELALERLPPGAVAVDVGTGSGCIAVSLAVHAPAARLIATDISAAALALARQNARRHGVARRITFVQTNLLAGVILPADVIVSNPPYISAADMQTLPPGVKQYEPSLALHGGDTGLRLIKELLRRALPALKTGGWLLVEIGAAQRQPALALAKALCPQAEFWVKKDLAGRDRVLLGRV